MGDSGALEWRAAHADAGSMIIAPRGLGALLSPSDLRIVFQPIVDLDASEVVGYEALARGPIGASSRIGG